MSSPFNATSSSTTFWSGDYNGRQIAAARCANGWVVYLDRVMQANRNFAGIEDAIDWLRHKVDDAEFDSPKALFGMRRATRTQATEGFLPQAG